MNDRYAYHSRSGNVLVMTIIILAGVASMMALSSDRVMGMHSMAGFNLRNQQAAYAAEAGASMVEGCLYAASGNTVALTTDIANTSSGVQSANTWMNYMGYVGPNGGPWPNLWIGNCMVQWRLEPATVYSQTYSSTPTGNFTYNYQANPSLQGTLPANALQNPGFYHYRIVATAYYMDDLGKHKDALGVPLTMATATPWSVTGQALAVAQVERFVELKMVNLFQYVIFYAATGPTGDIEFHPGASLAVTGAVQSNGSIYCGGGGTAFQSGQYHTSTCQGSPVTIGGSGSGNSVGISGVGGIYRERKAVNAYFARQNPLAAAVINPALVPMRGQTIPGSGLSMSGSNDLNGDDDSSSMFQLNGQNLTSVNDSRSNLTIAGTGGYIKDGNHGAAVVATLSNFPQLAGYPFEYQQIVPPAVSNQPTPLYNTGDGTNRFTVNPSLFPGAQMLFYTGAVGSAPTTTPGAGSAGPIYATDLPLYTFVNGAQTYQDVWPYQPSAPWNNQLVSATGAFAPAGTSWPPINAGNVPATLDTYLPVTSITPGNGMAVEGYFLNMSLHGLTNSRKTGLTIRERGASNTAFKWSTDADIAASTAPSGRLIRNSATPLAGFFPFSASTGGPYLAPVPTPASNGERIRAYAAMMKANYVVYLGVDAMTLAPFDITDAFFEYSLANPQATGIPLNPAAPSSGMIATQDYFLNCREASWMQYNNYMTQAQAAASRVDALTLNVGLICGFLSSTTWTSVDPGNVTGNTGNLSSVFNGVVYTHRTSRLAQSQPTLPNTYVSLPAYDPLAPLGYNPIYTPAVRSPGQLSAEACLGTSVTSAYPVVGAVGSVGNGVRVGQSNVWSVYPSTKTVRVFNGRAINWGGVQAAANNRPQGFTVITPNPCYLWGDYNVVTYPDSTGTAQVTPCAIYCDGLSVLSNRWVDGANSYGSGNNGAASSTSYVTSVVINNTPTDSENTYSEGSAGTHNVIRYCEAWGGQNWYFTGSLVVLNRMRYSRAYSSGVPAPGPCPISLVGANYGANNSGSYYGPPSRHYTFNNDLLTSMGQPPASLSGISVQRVVSTLNLINK